MTKSCKEKKKKHSPACRQQSDTNAGKSVTQRETCSHRLCFWGYSVFSDHLQESKMCSCIYSVCSCLVCRLGHWIAKPVFDSKTVWTVCAHKPCRSSLRLQQSEPLKVIVAEETVAQSSSDAFSPFVQRHQSDCWLGTETFSSLNFHSLRLFSARSSRLGMPLVLNTQIYFLRKL